jgi:hypothetical protein
MAIAWQKRTARQIFMRGMPSAQRCFLDSRWRMAQ